MNKYVFTRGALDKSISISPALPKPPGDREHPLKSERTRSRYCAADKTAPTEKAPVIPRHPDTVRRESWSPTKREFRLLDTETSTQLARYIADRILAAKHRIICRRLLFGKNDFVQSVLES